MFTLGIDPGNVESGYCFVDGDYSIRNAGKGANTNIIGLIKDMAEVPPHEGFAVVIESIQYYKNRPINQTTIENCYMIGRLIQACLEELLVPHLIPRSEYGTAICGTKKCDDATLWRALKLRFGGDKKGEPLHCLKGNTDKRSAYALCVYYLDGLKLKEE